MTTKFEIPIGDWSDDGHGKCQYFTVQTDKTLADVQKAYKAAQKQFKALDPEQFVCDYEDGTVPEEVIEAAEAAGLDTSDLLEPCYNDESQFTIYPETMAKFVCRFIMLVDPDLNLVVQKTSNRLQTGHIGYGLFQ